MVSADETGSDLSLKLSAFPKVLVQCDSLVSSTTSTCTNADSESGHSHHTQPSGQASDYADSDLSSVPENLAHPSMEESWLVTPPACFTLGVKTMQTSSMENLLIEHPSMSVYNHRGRPSSTGIESDQSRESSAGCEESGSSTGAATVATRPARPHQVLSVSPGALAPPRAIQTMQRAQKRQQNHKLSRGKLDRSNRVSQYQGSAKHLRRRHLLSQRHSGASNNRKQHC